jgi:diguanylate cyclase (GGDEF)-like protein
VTTILAAVGASLGTLVVVLAALLVRERRRQAAARRELTQTGEKGARERLLAELSTSIDLDEVLSRTLDAAGALLGVDAALVSVEGPDGVPLVATRGLSQAEAERHAVADSRAVRREKPSHNGDGIRSELAVPLTGEAGDFGYVTIFSRSSSGSLAHTAGGLEELARRAGPAIDNARRFREARQLADLDALTGLHNRRYFHETLAREVARAQRYDRNLALIVFDVDDFKAVNDRIGHLPGDSVLADAAERVRDAVRSADIACRVGGDEFAVILPESTLADADQLYCRIQSAVSARPIAEVGKLHLSAGIAELRPGDDGVTLFQRTDEALYRAKAAGKAQVAVAS